MWLQSPKTWLIDKTAAWFAETGKTNATIKEMVEGLQIGDSSIRQMIYTTNMVIKEIHAHLLAYNLLRGVMTESAKRAEVSPRQLSVKGAMQAVESFTPAMMATDTGDVLYHAMLTTVSAHRVGNRPGRQEPRLKKRRPVWRELMMKPRNEYHRRLNSEAVSH